MTTNRTRKRVLEGLFVQEGEAEQAVSLGAEMTVVHVADVESFVIKAGQIVMPFSDCRRILPIRFVRQDGRRRSNGLRRSGRIGLAPFSVRIRFFLSTLRSWRFSIVSCWFASSSCLTLSFSSPSSRWKAPTVASSSSKCRKRSFCPRTHTPELCCKSFKPGWRRPYLTTTSSIGISFGRPP